MKQSASTLIFIEKAQKLRGNKFDYSKVDYITNTTPVLIGCPDHGFLWSIPSTHLRKRTHGCRECGRVWQRNETLKKRSEKFFKDCMKKHGKKFDYSQAIFTRLDKPIKFKCPQHGEQHMVATLHLGKYGCRDCARDNSIKILKYYTDKKKIKAREEFKEKASKKHNGFYDYSNVEYIDNTTLISITCPIHGAFEQMPANHLYGYGCEPCGINTRADKKRKKLKDFISEAKVIHGQKYDYSEFVYKTTHTQGIIICSNPKHKKTPITPAHHLSGQGCSECGEEARDRYRRSSGHNTESWIAKAKELHGDRYDYSKADYKGYDCAITIICEEHGPFKLEPAYQHIETERRRGCGECSSKESKHSVAIQMWLIKNNFDFIKEWSHPTCKDIKVLRFDYYLPKYNACIEYDGEQHFQLGPWGHNDEDKKNNFIQGRRRDAIKSLWCIENRMRLIRITSKTKLKKINKHLEKLIPSTLDSDLVDVECPKSDKTILNKMGEKAYLNALIYWGDYVRGQRKISNNWLKEVPEFVLGKER